MHSGGEGVGKHAPPMSLIEREDERKGAREGGRKCTSHREGVERGRKREGDKNDRERVRKSD